MDHYKISSNIFLIRPNFTSAFWNLKRAKNRWPSHAPRSLWSSIVAYLTINCTILYLWISFSLIYATLTMICKVFYLKSAFLFIRPLYFRPNVIFDFFIFGQYFFRLFNFWLYLFDLFYIRPYFIVRPKIL